MAASSSCDGVPIVVDTGIPPDPRTCPDVVIEVPHTDIIKLKTPGPAGPTLLNVLTGEQYMFSTTEPVELYVLPCTRGGFAYVSVGTKSVWVNALRKWAVWEIVATKRRFAFARDAGRVSWKTRW